MRTDLTYGGTAAVRVLVRHRPGWYDFSDDAAGVEAAGRPDGWYEVALQVVRELDLNLNRRGVVCVSSPDHREQEWLDSLEERVADASLAVYEALLELDE